MLHTNFKKNRSFGPFVSHATMTILNNCLFLRPSKATYEIRLPFAKWFQRRSHLKFWTDGRRRLPISEAPTEHSAQVCKKGGS